MTTKIPVIYILSNGRSGSTLLDLLLGLHPQLWTMGEAQILPWELKENRQPCGCGEAIGECEFWGPILPQIPLFIGDYPIEYFREHHNSGKVLRWAHLNEIRRRELSGKHQAAAQAYGQLNHEYFSAVWQAAERYSGGEIRYLVDASKDPYRLHWLQQHGGFEIYVIHLLKDPRAFVYSMTKSNPNLLTRSGRFAGRWAIENTIFSYMGNDPALVNRTQRIRYEDMASSPDTLLTRLGNWLDLEFKNVDPGQFRVQMNHGVSGNPMRWRDSQIVLDEKWRSAMPQASANLVWAMTGPGAVKYGYKRES